MKFSVAIAVYNKAPFIAETLKSVLAQTYTDFEIVIINDGSTDNSEEEILKFKDPRIRYFKQENQGAGAARNAAIKKAKYPYIALLDADDYWFPFYLEEQKKSIEKFPEEFVFATAMQKKIGDQVFDKQYSVDLNLAEIIRVNYFEASYLYSVLHSSSMVIHKAVFDKIGDYDPSIKSGQDTDLYVRIGLEYQVVFSKRICAQHIIRENSLFMTTKSLADKADFEAYEVYEKENPALKKFLDLNRYSLAILAKLDSDKKGFERNYQKIDLQNLSKRQRFLLNQNKSVLKSLMKVKSNLESLGMRLGTFKS